jgi:hypothetical protein
MTGPRREGLQQQNCISASKLKVVQLVLAPARA